MTAAVDMLAEIGAETVSPLITSETAMLPANATASCFGANRSRSCLAAALGDGSVAITEVREVAMTLPGLAPKKATRLHVSNVEAHQVAAVGIVPFGDGFVSSGQDGRICFLSRDEGATSAWRAEPWFATDGEWIETLAASPTGKHVAFSFARRVVVIGKNGGIRCEVDLPATVTGIAFDQPGKRLAISHYDGVTMIALAKPDAPTLLKWKGPHIAVTWSPDDRYVVTATQEKELHAWDLVTMQDFRMGGYPRKVRSFSWLHSGDILCCSGADVVTAWSFAGAGPGRKPPLEIGFVFGGTVCCVAAHPTRSHVAGGFSSGNVQIGATAKGEAVCAQARTGAPVTSLAWSPDGTYLASVDGAGLLSLFTVPKDLGVR